MLHKARTFLFRLFLIDRLKQRALETNNKAFKFLIVFAYMTLIVYITAVPLMLIQTLVNDPRALPFAFISVLFFPLGARFIIWMHLKFNPIFWSKG